MYKVGICGHFEFKGNPADGQIDKTRAVWSALKKALGEDQVAVLDTHGWKKNPIALFVNCYKLLKECDNVIMMPAHGAIKVFPALFGYMNRLFNHRLHYIVIGGWLPEKLRQNPRLCDYVAKLDRVYVELRPMLKSLSGLGLNNVVYMPNFRETNSLAPNELIYSNNEPYRLCTFSRVTPEKGIEKAIQAVRYANNSLGRTAFTLDIFGKIDPEYSEKFATLCKDFESYIRYKGFIDTKNSTDELKTCFALLFPTSYYGEGFAGAVIDAFVAGVPVIATDWNYNSHIIRNGEDGIIYDPKTEGLLGKILVDAANNPQQLNNMKLNCLERAAHFEADEAVKTLLNELQ